MRQNRNSSDCFSSSSSSSSTAVSQCSVAAASASSTGLSSVSSSLSSQPSGSSSSLDAFTRGWLELQHQRQEKDELFADAWQTSKGERSGQSEEDQGRRDDGKNNMLSTAVNTMAANNTTATVDVNGDVDLNNDNGVAGGNVDGGYLAVLPASSVEGGDGLTSTTTTTSAFDSCVSTLATADREQHDGTLGDGMPDGPAGEGWAMIVLSDTDLDLLGHCATADSSSPQPQPSQPQQKNFCRSSTPPAPLPQPPPPNNASHPSASIISPSLFNSTEGARGDRTTLDYSSSFRCSSNTTDSNIGVSCSGHSLNRSSGGEYLLSNVRRAVGSVREERDEDDLLLDTTTYDNVATIESECHQTTTDEDGAGRGRTRRRENTEGIGGRGGGGGGDLAGGCRRRTYEEEEERRNCAVLLDVTGELLEDVQKKRVWVIHQGVRSPVSWYHDTPKEDVREAIMCACDAMMDAGFILVAVAEHSEDDDLPSIYDHPLTESDIDRAVVDDIPVVLVRGRAFGFEDFGELVDGENYLLQSAVERSDLKDIVGDRWRRLRVCVDPTLHVETQKALQKMKKGTNILKHTRFGFPHLRQFQLSADCKRILWYSGAKSKGASVVLLREVSELRLGQTTPIFSAYKLPMLEHLSFSVIYGAKNNTLDLTCKDEFEFDYWVAGLKAVVYKAKGKDISKEQLLSHSRRFRDAVGRRDVSIKLSCLPETRIKGSTSLDDCIDLPVHTLQELEQKTDKLHGRLASATEQFRRLERNGFGVGRGGSRSSLVDLALLTGSGNPAYASVFNETTEAEDEELEIARLGELIDTVTSLLQHTRNQILAANNNALVNPQINGAGKDETEMVVVSISSEGEIVSRPKHCLSSSTPPPSSGGLASSFSGFMDSLADPLALANGWFGGASALTDGHRGEDRRRSSALSDGAEPEQTKQLKRINQLLWKAEVDLENVEDMLSRASEGTQPAIATAVVNSLTEMNSFVAEEVQRLGDTVQKFGDSVSSAVLGLFSVDDALPPPAPPLSTSASFAATTNVTRFY
eukprot:GHVS01009054.1.p1 GENE.GHVS01009054.1~~GHVS01009054.1.p1  ORF type:complete len:1032 (+),score=217.95 GHVS01009054.1:80-3175(+)